MADQHGVASYFWVLGTETDSVVVHFSEHPAVRDIRAVDSTDKDHLLGCEWAPDYDTVLDALSNPGPILLSACGTAEGWTFEIRGETHDAIAEFRQYCHTHDIAVTCTALHALQPPDTRNDLTGKQREALIQAFNEGYFDSPRATTLDDVADGLGISRQALASRLRRGTRRLVKQSLHESSA